MDPTMGAMAGVTPEERTRFYEMLSRLTDEERRRLVESSSMDEESANLGARAKLGFSEMGLQGPQGIRAGGTYVAASPLSHLSTALRQGFGAKMMKDAMVGQEAMVPRKRGLVDVILKMLRGEDPTQSPATAGLNSPPTPPGPKLPGGGMMAPF